MPGSARLRDCEVLRKITSKQAEENRLYGAICAAPAVTLLPWGLLKKKKVLCLTWISIESVFIAVVLNYCCYLMLVESSRRVSFPYQEELIFESPLGLLEIHMI